MTLTEALYLILIFSVLLILMSSAVYTLFLIYSWLKGAPFVATEQKELAEILKKAKLKKGSVFIELGSGDGRVVRTAVNIYAVLGVGIDINPLLNWYAKLISKLQKLDQIYFFTQNVFDADLSKADVIYLFLFPALLKRLKKKFLHKTKRPLLIISHGFKIDYLATYLKEIRKGKKFSTYYYHLQ